jgi:hypothetical protein
LIPHPLLIGWIHCQLRGWPLPSHLRLNLGVLCWFAAVTPHHTYLPVSEHRMQLELAHPQQLPGKTKKQHTLIPAMRGSFYKTDGHG